MIELMFIISLLLIAILIALYRKVSMELEDTKFAKHSLSSKYGKISEQFMPFMKDYPYDPQNFRFIGTPVDGIQFEGDRIIFIEFKTGDSRLSAKQRGIRDILSGKKIEFKEIRIK